MPRFASAFIGAELFPHTGNMAFKEPPKDQKQQPEQRDSIWRAAAKASAQVGAVGMPGTMLGPVGLSPGAAGAAAQTVGQQAASTEWAQNYVEALPKPKTYLDKRGTERTDALVDLMKQSKGVLEQNRVSARGEAMMAGVMTNEGGKNAARETLGRHFNKDAELITSYLSQKKIELADFDLGQFTEYAKKQKLSPEQLSDIGHLAERAKTGELNLHDKDQVLQAGIDRRTSQYERMQELERTEKKTPEQQAELKSLQNVSADGIENRAKLQDLDGLSADRFRELYDEGQTRFELDHFKSYKTKIAAAEKDRDDHHPSKVLGGYFNDQAKSLRKMDVSKIKLEDPKVAKRYTSDQQFLIALAQDGKLDLNNPEQVAMMGAERRLQQFEQMQSLRQTLADPSNAATDKESTAERKQMQAELKSLEQNSELGLGQGVTMGSLGDLSAKRFKEIYEPDSANFDAKAYLTLQRGMDKRLADAQKKDPSATSASGTLNYAVGRGKVNRSLELSPELYAQTANNSDALADLASTRDVRIQHSAGNLVITEEMQQSVHENSDLLADMSTSYGINQILGAYGTQPGLLHAKDAAGKDSEVTLSDLKESGKRLSPSPEDVREQIAFMNMKNVNLVDPPDYETLAAKYNGSGWRTSNPDYATNAQRGASNYTARKAALQAAEDKIQKQTDKPPGQQAPETK